MKKIKKKKEGSSTHRTFEKLMKKHEKRKSGESNSSSSSQCTSEDEGEYFADLFSTKRKKKQKKKKDKKESKSESEQSELDKEKERRHAAELKAATAAAELKAIKDGVVSLKENGDAITHEKLNKVFDEATPTRPPAPSKTPKAKSEKHNTGFFAGCFDEDGTNLTPERGAEVWKNITAKLEKCAGDGYPSPITVTAEVEKRCKKLATVLCDSHLLHITIGEVMKLADDYGVRGSNSTKPNITKAILRAIAWRSKGNCLGYDVVGVDDELQPF